MLLYRFRPFYEIYIANGTYSSSPTPLIPARHVRTSPSHLQLIVPTSLQGLCLVRVPAAVNMRVVSTRPCAAIADRMAVPSLRSHNCFTEHELWVTIVASKLFSGSLTETFDS